MMYRIRFHGRGGQGMKTASRILGSALFNAGFEVQDAPRYGAERRGAPIFAYVRADIRVINERGIITNPDLIVVADETLIPIPSVNVTQGAAKHTLMLILSNEKPEIWQQRLNFSGQIITVKTGSLDANPDHHFNGIISTAAAAALIGEIRWCELELAIRQELSRLGEDIIAKNLEYATSAYQQQKTQAKVKQNINPPIAETPLVEWVDLEFAPAQISAPAIHTGLTSVEVRTGLWRTRRPIINRSICHRCWWICSTYCPDGAIDVDANNSPHIDYDHCKGCMVCLSQCPHHAISATLEQDIETEQKKGALP